MNKRTIILSMISLCLFTSGCFLAEDKPMSISEVKIINQTSKGARYKLSNIKKGTYEIKIQAKEYEGTNLNSTKTIAFNTFTTENNGSIDISIYKDNLNIYTKINDIITFNNFNSLFGIYDDKVGVSILDKNKEFILNETTPILMYSIGEDSESIKNFSLSDKYKLGVNKEDVVLFLNIKKVDNRTKNNNATI